MKYCAFIIACLFVSSVNAGVITVEDQNVNTGNCIPFGCAGQYGPFMTSIYKDIDAFSLNAGDTIAFDLSGTNDVDIILDIFLASTTTNGSIVADSFGFTKVVSGGNGGRGTSIQGDYELEFTLDNSWDYAGGGLMIGFSPVGVTAGDATWSTGFYGNANAANTHVGQYYRGSSVGTGTYRPSVIPNFQITTNPIPEPFSLTLLGIGLVGLGFSRKKKTA